MSEIKKVVDGLKKIKSKFWRTGEFDQYLEQNGITLSESSFLELFRNLLNDGDEDLFNLVSKEVPKAISENTEFLNLVLDISKKIGIGIAMVDFFNSLPKICELNPVLGLKLAERFLGEGDDKFVEYAALCIGISGRTNKVESKKFNEQLLESKNLIKKAAGIRVLKLIYMKNHHDDSEDVIKLLVDYLEKEKDFGVKLELLVAFLELYDMSPEVCKKNIIRLMDEDPKFRFRTIDALWRKTLSNKQDIFDLIRRSIHDKNFQMRQICYDALTHLVKDFPKEIMHLLHDNIEDFGFDFGHSSWLLQELGKHSLQQCLDVTEEWISSPQDFRTRFHLPIMINALISQKECNTAFSHIEKWVKNSDTKEIGLNILLEILSEQYKTKFDPQFVQNSLNLLTAQASAKNLDIDKILGGEDKDILKCAKLIEAIKYLAEDLDYDLIDENLKNFCNIKQIFGDNWFQTMRSENEKLHPVLRILSRNLSDNNFDRTYLNDLDEKLGKLIASGKSTGYTNKLRNHDQYDETLAEIDFIVPFLDKFSVDIEPPLNGKNLDVGIKVLNEYLYIEIFSPDMFKPLKLLNGAFGIPNRVRGKIYDKYKNQLILASEKNEPIIVAIDIGRSEIDYESIEEYLFGSNIFSFLINTKTHETVGTAMKRSDNAMSDLKPEMNIISAVICYKTRIESDGKSHTFGKIIKNPLAKFPLAEPIEELIVTTLFN